MKTEDRLPVTMLFLRLSVFLVIFLWTLDKFLHPQHASAIYQKFYFISGLGDSAFFAIGAVEMVLLAGFVVGFQKRITYGAILLFHAVSTLSSFRQYLAPFESANLLFFAAWPMLAAAFALYYLRDFDVLWVVDKPRAT